MRLWFLEALPFPINCLLICVSYLRKQSDPFGLKFAFLFYLISIYNLIYHIMYFIACSLVNLLPSEKQCCRILFSPKGNLMLVTCVQRHGRWHVMGKSASLLPERGRGRDQGQKALKTILKTTQSGK